MKDWGESESPRGDHQYDSVVVGLAPEHFHYQKLTEAFQLLKQGARLVAINKSRLMQDLLLEQELLSLHLNTLLIAKLR